MSTREAATFALEGTLAAAPEAVTKTVQIRVVDTLAAAVAGYEFEDAAVIDRFSRRFEGNDARLLDGSGRTRSLAGAVLANATAANVLDIDDGHRLVKGHPAAVVVPAAIAASETVDASIDDLLEAVYVGYELAVRAGLTIHEETGIYSGTGSWGAIGAAAAVCRLLECDRDTTEQAIGIADYHAPRTPITRGVEKPGMTKDGIGWGAYTGYEAVELAREGFIASGSPFDNSDRVETLGSRHYVTESYLKPYPCCRWAQPGLEAALELRRQPGFTSVNLEHVTVETFSEATTLTETEPGSVAEAEYAYPYPVAVALHRGRFSPKDLTAEARACTAVTDLARKVDLETALDLDERFPKECLARVRVETSRGVFESGTTRARGARERPLSETDRFEKHRQLFEFADVDSVEHIYNILDKSNVSLTELIDTLESG
ncbi:MmgE/PrpD family protein [Natronorubrum thiooxidans]|uniref:2-methylcitrate dehydratase PrpD n=1 Tax=Natronorubrum thiooxidans TaxID=308853 RepID=A0A1N7H3T7_9EURY|nr:MmgE/PrpD family protein [Natronorubrum thiooxidans]SIS19504.1 2-methylcitrate dehydratase PrpD [Natronorubrum thiooxidans]